MIKFEGMMYGVSVIKNVNLIEAILNRKVNARLATIGGLDPFDYDVKRIYDIEAIPFMATRAQIEKAVS